VSELYEGDLIRPLGLVTLHFAYAEAELDLLLEALSSSEPYDDRKRQWPVGRKLNYAQRLIRRLQVDSLAGLIAVLRDARALFERRNALVHSSIFTGGRMVSNRQSVANQYVSGAELTQLAEQIFSWKEQLYAQRSRQLMPLLATGETPRGT
jgi:hypothetical protein